MLFPLWANYGAKPFRGGLLFPKHCLHYGVLNSFLEAVEWTSRILMLAGIPAGVPRENLRKPFVFAQTLAYKTYGKLVEYGWKI